MRNAIALPSKFAHRVWWATAVLLLAGAAPAGAIAPAVDCRAPYVFPDAAVNVVILPYISPYSNEGLSSAARQLTLLMELEALFSILKYESVGVIRLIGPPTANPECTAEVVLEKLSGLRRGAERRLKPGHGVVLVWGRIYEEGESIYIQNYMQFLRLGAVEDFQISILGRPFAAKFPAQAVAFPPQRLTTHDVGRIAQAFAASVVLRSSPSDSASGTPMPLDASASRNYSYYVTQVQGEWMYLDAYGTGPSGWVRRQQNFDWTQVAKGGKLDLVEALVGYLRYRVDKDAGGRQAPSRTAMWAAEAANRFERRSVENGADAPMALALAKTVRAYFDANGREPNLARAWSLLREVVTLVPFSSDARNLELQTRLSLAYQRAIPGTNASQVNNDFLKAATLDPENALLLANMEQFYELSLSPQRLPGAEDDKFYERARLVERLQVVHNARAVRPAPDRQPPGTEYASNLTLDVMVHDAAGALVPNVAITIMHRASGRVRNATTDQQGHAVITNLPPGEYRVRANAPGFSSKQVVVTLQQQASQAVTIQIGPQT